MEVGDLGEGRPELGPVTHPRHSNDNPASDSAPAPTLCSMPQVRRTWSQDMNMTCVIPYIVCLYWYCAPLSNTCLPGLAAAAAAPPGPAAAGLQGGSLRDPARPAP